MHDTAKPRWILWARPVGLAVAPIGEIVGLFGLAIGGQPSWIAVLAVFVALQIASSVSVVLWTEKQWRESARKLDDRTQRRRLLAYLNKLDHEGAQAMAAIGLPSATQEEYDRCERLANHWLRQVCSAFDGTDWAGSFPNEYENMSNYQMVTQISSFIEDRRQALRAIAAQISGD